MIQEGMTRAATIRAHTTAMVHRDTATRARFSNAAPPNRGKCTVEVIVDGAADVEIRGDSAVLRNLTGQPPEWRRFQCTGPLPANPVNFRSDGPYRYRPPYPDDRYYDPRGGR
jgi:hypothetical protein